MNFFCDFSIRLSSAKVGFKNQQADEITEYQGEDFL
jgi:hypothetical protein